MAPHTSNKASVGALSVPCKASKYLDNLSPTGFSWVKQMDTVGSHISAEIHRQRHYISRGSASLPIEKGSRLLLHMCRPEGGAAHKCLWCPSAPSAGQGWKAAVVDIVQWEAG